MSRVQQVFGAIWAVVAVVALAGCNDNAESEGECDSNYEDQCSTDGSVVLYCAGGKIVSQKCNYACDAGHCVPKPTQTIPGPVGPVETKCDSSTYVQQCLDADSYGYCENGVEKKHTCDNGCDDQTGKCVVQKPVTCDEIEETCDGTTHVFCEPGVGRQTEVCPYGCDATAKRCYACDSTYEATCTTPHKLTTCRDGYFRHEKCRNGAMCNKELNRKECRTPNVGDKCDPEAFSEFCYGTTEARYCDETGKVKKLDCTAEYGKGYQCDIAENFYGVDRDVATCYSAQEDCSTDGASKWECTYQDEEDEYRQFISLHYVCGTFSTGLHYYVSEMDYCDAGTTCRTKDGRCSGK